MLLEGQGPADRTRPVSASGETGELPPLPVLLLRARLAVASRFNRALRRHDLTEPQWRVLASLSRERFPDVASLAGRLDLLSPSVSRILRDLEGRGLLRLAAGGADARRTVAAITPAGRDVIARTSADLEPVHDLIRARVGDEQVRALQLALSHLITALRGEDGGTGEDPDAP